MTTTSKASRALRVLIVGCGNIAGGLDRDRPKGRLPHSHAGAYARDGRFDLAACVDPDDGRRSEFMAAWSVPGGSRSMDDLAGSEEHFDVISICSPSISHTQSLDAALRLKPGLIFCEKPVTTSLADAERLVAECGKARIPLAVNHTRRWDPDMSRLQADVRAGKWGKLRSVTGLYNKGILNNGTHMLDLLHMLVGPMEIVKVGKSVSDFFPDDPSVPVWLEGENGLPVYLACGHAGDYAIFELQFVFSQGVLAMEDGGLFWRERRAADSQEFKGYRMLDAGVRRAGGDAAAMGEAVDNIYRTITKGDKLASTGESALVAQRTCERIRNLATTQST